MSLPLFKAALALAAGAVVASVSGPRTILALQQRTLRDNDAAIARAAADLDHMPAHDDVRNASAALERDLATLARLEHERRRELTLVTTLRREASRSGILLGRVADAGGAVSADIAAVDNA